MKRTAEPHIWEQEITDYHSLLIDTARFNIRLIEDHKGMSDTRTEVLKTWDFDHDPTISDFGMVLKEVPEIIGVEFEL